MPFNARNDQNSTVNIVNIGTVNRVDIAVKLGAPREGGKRMAVSEKKKASNAKWDSANMSTLGCRVKKAQAAAFKAYCEAQGKTSNTVLKEYVLDCIGEGDEWSDNEPT